MFAFFSLGAQELVILLLIGLLLVGGPIIALVVVLALVRRRGQTGDPGAVAELQSEVERLRMDMEGLKRRQAEQDAARDRPS